MTGWDIEPAGVYGVLSRTATAAKGLSDAHSAMQDNLKEAADSAGTLTNQYGPYTSTAGVVGSALAQFLEHWSPQLLSVAKRASMSLHGADEATRDYMRGSLEQAANAQHQAVIGKLDMPGQTGTGHHPKDPAS
ncbi:DUF6507 family protein [Streptomyces sp. NPDC047028]|uniref:DUF6507 family protein n=1 Tax=Streptomyces sp. NPDC047028 TaxID=3155793 RepID=UPI0033D31438